MQTISIATDLVANFSDSIGATADTPRIAGPELTFTVADDVTDAAIAELAWTVGNRQKRDDAGLAWPSNVRSMSIGDVVHIRTNGDFTTLRSMVAVMVGFEPVDTLAVVRASSPSEDEPVEGLTDGENALAFDLYTVEGFGKDEAIAEAKRRYAAA